MRVILEKRVFMRAFKIRRGILMRAFQCFTDKKESKMLIFEIEKTEEKKTYDNEPESLPHRPQHNLKSQEV